MQAIFTVLSLLLDAAKFLALSLGDINMILEVRVSFPFTGSFDLLGLSIPPVSIPKMLVHCFKDW